MESFSGKAGIDLEGVVITQVHRFKSNPLWMQYTQCHNDWNTEPADAEEEEEER